MAGIVSEFILDNGKKITGVKCSECKKIEHATSEETLKRFVNSLQIAGWKWKVIGQKWICVKCNTS